MTRFGYRYGKSLMDLLVEASLRALDDADLGGCDVDAVYVSSMLSGELTSQTALGSALVDQLALFPAAADRLENGPASGGSAVKNACLAVASGAYDLALVAGGEKMRHVPGDAVTDLISTMTHPTAEYVHGVTLPSIAAMFARLYMRRYGLRREHLAMVAIKNHANALKNPYAHIRRPITMEGILYAREAEVNNPMVADPLRLYDCCPISDGAAAIVVCAAERAREFCDTPVVVAGIGHATDTLAVHEREDPTVLKAVRVASQKAFAMAKLAPDDIDVAELHDAFTILEIAESEDAGFFAKGTGHRALEEGATSLDGKLPINPSGGLKARGHPVGATGVAQIVELTWQLRGEAEGRQVSGAERAYCCNLGGFGNNVIAFVLRRGD
ncbi:TPA: thiolase domain-containing protein [Candidatus Bathyarchaeota archaeon]|nr:thiolase domain-containing protein [Candidatus Bathyarchaeota archaeon]